MDVVLSHQALKKRGLLVDFGSTDGLVAAFVSHQWCCHRHADPQFNQLRVLKGVFRNAAAGTLHVNLDMFGTFVYHTKPSVRASELRSVQAWALWYDYFSVPQPGVAPPEAASDEDSGENLGKAVASLSSYVQQCKYFFILAPVVRHEAGHYIDYTAWKSRGWCRLERLSRALSPSATSLLLVRREDTIFEVGPDEYLFDPVARGSFSHNEDRGRLEPMVKRLVSHKLSSLLAAGRSGDFRSLVSWCPLLLDGFEGITWRGVYPEGLQSAGLPDKTPQAWVVDAADDFTRLMFLPQVCMGPAPVLLAAACGEVPVLRTLLDRRAGVGCAERRTSARFFRFAGQQPLHVAAARGHASTVAFLLGRRADVNARDSYGLGPLHLAMYPGDVEAARVLIEHRADINAINKMDGTVLEVAANYGRADMVRMLLAAGARGETRPGSTSALHGAALFGGGVDVVRSLLEGRVSPHNMMSPEPCKRSVILLLKALSLAYRMGRRTFLTSFGHHTFGATPLHLAVMIGNWGEARALLDAGADAGAQNAAGATARDVAVAFSTLENSPLPDL